MENTKLNAEDYLMKHYWDKPMTGNGMREDLAKVVVEYAESVHVSRTLSAVPSELLEKLEELSKIVPIPPKAITYENGVEIVDFVQDTIMPEYYNWIKRGIAG